MGTTVNWDVFDTRGKKARSHNSTRRQGDGWCKNPKEGKVLADDFAAFCERYEKQKAEAAKTPEVSKS